MESGQHSTSPESIHEEDRFKDLPEFKSGSNGLSQPKLPDIPVTIIPAQPVVATKPQLQPRLQPQQLRTNPILLPTTTTLEPVETVTPDNNVISFIKAVTNPQSGLYVSTLPQKEHPSLYEEENPNRGFTIGYKITF